MMAAGWNNQQHFRSLKHSLCTTAKTGWISSSSVVLLRFAARTAGRVESGNPLSPMKALALLRAGA
jgi:hypothetical protein